MVKAFCAECGSSLFGGTWPEGPEVSIRLGTLDGDPGIRPQYHSHVASKAEWDELPQDGLPRFEEGPPPAPKELAVVRAWFDAISRGDERAVAAALADNVVVELNRPGFFGNGTFEGRSAALRWMADWYYEFAPGSYRAELVELIPAGEHVVAHATIRARGRTSEAETEMEVYYDFTIAGERIAAFGAFSERAEALRAAGLGPHES
jgi:ketosteroid isomerase-like protein